MDHKISIIIPTYKPKSYIFDCLFSLKHQTISYDTFEIIIILNGCCEPWKSTLMDFVDTKMAGIDVRIIQTDESGVSNARNIGLDNARYSNIMFLDDDDYISSQTLLSLTDIIDGTSVIIFKPMAFIDGEDVFFEYSRTHEYNNNEGKGKIPFTKARKVFSGPVMKLFPSWIIGDRRYDTDYANGEDSLFMFLISDRMKFVVYANSNAVYYRRVRRESATSLSRSFWQVFKNSFKLIYSYTYIFLRGFPRYNFYFFITRILGAGKAVLYYKKNTY